VSPLASTSTKGGVVRFYAVYVTGGMEERVALIFRERARALGLDVRSIIVPSDTKGFIVVELGNPGHLHFLVRGVRNVKRRRPVLLREEEIEKLVKPRMEVEELKPGDIVEALAGPFKGMRGRVESVNLARGEVDIRLLDSNIDRVVLYLDQVRKVEEAREGG